MDALHEQKLFSNVSFAVQYITHVIIEYFNEFHIEIEGMTIFVRAI